ncbi:MAG: hypothetical protein E7580_02165 [Ruminococcaceae bacterium]|nr:hypothetical protein [Oscillospiraceae bacterium]
MKKFLFVVLAVLMILPVAVSCGQEKTKDVEMKSVEIASYIGAYNEDGTLDETKITSISTGTAIAKVPEGEKLSVKHVILGYDESAYIENDTLLKTFAGINAGANTENDEYMWIVYVNDQDAKLSDEVKPEDVIKIVCERGEVLAGEEAENADAAAAAN